MAKQLAKDLINAGAHFGHGSSRWNPKMAPYIFAKRGTIHIIDIKKTLEGMLIAKKLLAEIVASGKDVVFVGTKRQAQKPVQKAAEKCGMHYVAQRWLGGTLTNFRTVRSSLQRLEELEAMQENGTLESESKKMASRLKREIRKLFTNLNGIRKMSKLPGAIIAVDAKKEHLALHEAKKLNIPTIALLDTDSDPDTTDVAIPINDDSMRAVDLILAELADAVAIGKTMIVAKPEPMQRPQRPMRVRAARTVAARADDKPQVEESQEQQTPTAVATEEQEPEPETSTEEQKPETETEA